MYNNHANLSEKVNLFMQNVVQSYILIKIHAMSVQDNMQCCQGWKI